MAEPEVWLRGPVPGIPPSLMPVAHALLQVLEEVESALRSVPSEQLWHSPGGAAPIGYHVRHLAGSIDRLFTYARGEVLSESQRVSLRQEGVTETSETADVLAERLHTTINTALDELRRTAPETLHDYRSVGRSQLPSTVLGLLFHAAEHAQRHGGQIATTLKILHAR
jgi:hypothetical protein